ncbi:hypothetical protein U8Q05_25795 [Rhizobium ruizarguesonis]|nr:hypothetical protein U8Q05_25795 [Rhizobium ruizarguesonis]
MAHKNAQIAIAELGHGKPLTPTDIRELQAMLLTAGIGDAKHLEKATEIAHGFGAFVRSLVGARPGGRRRSLLRFCRRQWCHSRPD